MLFKDHVEHQRLFRLALAAFCLAIFVVMLGAFTRLADAGLGCPDWPGCYGHLLWPNEAHEVLQAEAKFPDAPVEHDKTWPEMVHRYFAGTLGLLILAIAIFSIRQYRQAGTVTSCTSSSYRVPLKLPLFLLVLVIIQAMFGMWTVTLKLWPQVVTAHLLGGFATLSLLWLLVQRLGGASWQLDSSQRQSLARVKPLLMVALIAVVVQIALGGWVSSNYAALACPDLPKCLGQWVPPMDMQKGFNIGQDIGPNYLGGQLDNHARTAIHWVHRLGAITVTLLLFFTGLALWRVAAADVRRWVIALAAVLVLQLTLGLSNIIWALPLTVAVAHNAVGALLLLIMVSICYRTSLVMRQ